MQLYATLILLPFTLASLLGMEKPIPLKRRGSTDELPQMPDAPKKKHSPEAKSLLFHSRTTHDQCDNPLYQAIKAREHSRIKDILNAGGIGPIKRTLTCIEKVCVDFPEDGEKMLTAIITHKGLHLYTYLSDDNQKSFLISIGTLNPQQVENLAESQKASPLTASIKATIEAMKQLSHDDSSRKP